MRYTIRRRGMIMGTYAGATEAEALDTLAKDEGHKDFADLCKKLSLKRDDHKLDEVVE